MSLSSFVRKLDPTPAIQKNEKSILTGIAVTAAIVASGGSATPAVAAGIAAAVNDANK